MKKILFTLFISFSALLIFAQNTLDFKQGYQNNPLVSPGIIEAWSFAQTRMQVITSDSPESCSGMPLPFGVMGLFENGKDYFVPNAVVVSNLSGVSIPEMKANTQNQINAFAKAYNSLMTSVIAENGGSYKTLKNIYDCIIQLSEIPSEGAVNIYARDLQAYEILSFIKSSEKAAKYNFGIPQGSLAEVFGEDNYSVLSSKRVGLSTDGILADNKAYSVAHLKSTQYGPAVWNPAPSCNYSFRSGTAVSAITIHTIQGSYAGAISWSQNCASNVSFHYVVRSSDGQITQMVDEANKAWHVGSENPYTIGYEHEGFVNNPSWYTTAMYNNSADLSRDIILSGYGIPAVRTYYGVATTGTNTLGGCTKIKGHQHFAGQTHTDPGVNWNWEKYYRLINNAPVITTLTGVTGNLFDTGGSAGNYADDERKIWVLSPAGASAVSLNFSQFNIENGYDKMFIYNGNSINATLIGTYTGTTSPGTVIGTSGSLTIEFRSDCATTASGWSAAWTATTPVPPDVTPPTTAITVDANWKTQDWNASFTDNDAGSGLESQYYLVGSKIPNYNGWMSNGTYGFLNEDFQDNINNWNMENGNFSMIGNQYVTNDLSDGNTNSWSTVIQNSGESYLYHWKQNITSSGSNQRAGLHFFCDDATLPNRGNSYFVYFREESNRVQIYHVTNDVFSLEKDDTCVVNENTLYDYKVTYNPQTGKIRVFSNDVLVCSYTDPNPITSGNAVSLRSGNCTVEYDNIRVYHSRTSSEPITVGLNKEFFEQSNIQQNAGLVRSYAVDNAGNWSPEDYTLHLVDWSVPQNVALNDGSLTDVDSFFTTTINANWNIIDANSGMTGIKYGIGTAPMQDDVVAFSSQSLATQMTEVLANAIDYQIYFINVIAENNAGLIDTFSTDGQVYYGSLSLADISLLEEVTVFPNPSSKILNINNLPLETVVEIYDASGKLILSKIAGNFLEIQVSSWSDGKYLIKLAKGSVFKTINFVKQ